MGLGLGMLVMIGNIEMADEIIYDGTYWKVGDNVGLD